MEARKLKYDTVEVTEVEESPVQQQINPIIEKLPFIVEQEAKDIADLKFFALVAVQSIMTVLISLVLLSTYKNLPIVVSLGLASLVSFYGIKKLKNKLKTMFYNRINNKKKVLNQASRKAHNK